MTQEKGILNTGDISHEIYSAGRSLSAQNFQSQLWPQTLASRPMLACLGQIKNFTPLLPLTIHKSLMSLTPTVTVLPFRYLWTLASLQARKDCFIFPVCIRNP